MYHGTNFRRRNPFLKTIDDCVLTVKVYKRDIQVKFSSLNNSYYVSEPEKQERLAKRSKIIKFSFRSVKRL